MVDASTIDLTPVLTPLIQIAGIALATLAGWVLTRLAQKFGIQGNTASMQNIDDAAMKSIQAAVMASQQTIALKGWDHVQTQNQLVAIAATYMPKFKTTLAQAGIDPGTEQGKASIRDIITRALPAGVTQAAASPTTPPTDDQKAASVVTVATVPSKPA